jgi:hypothetical protein
VPISAIVTTALSNMAPVGHQGSTLADVERSTSLLESANSCWPGRLTWYSCSCQTGHAITLCTYRMCWFRGWPLLLFHGSTAASRPIWSPCEPRLCLPVPTWAAWCLLSLTTESARWLWRALIVLCVCVCVLGDVLCWRRGFTLCRQQSQRGLTLGQQP